MRCQLGPKKKPWTNAGACATISVNSNWTPDVIIIILGLSCSVDLRLFISVLQNNFILTITHMNGNLSNHYL